MAHICVTGRVESSRLLNAQCERIEASRSSSHNCTHPRMPATEHKIEHVECRESLIQHGTSLRLQTQDPWSDKGRRCGSTSRIRRTICRIADACPGQTQVGVINEVEKQLEIRVPAPTLSRILRKRESWNSASLLERRRLRIGQHPQLEMALIA